MAASTASAWCGQAALRPLPTSTTPQQRLVNYQLPQKLQGDRRNFVNTTTANPGGLDVLKVTKNGKLQGRRIAISSSRRSILVTSNRIRSVKGFFKYAMPRQNRETPMKMIDIAAVDRIQRGTYTKRFLQARTSNTFKSVEANCLSIIYRTSHENSPLLEGMGSPSSSSKLTNPKGVPHRFESLDLVVSNPKDLEMIASVLENLVEIYREERNRYDRDVVLLEHYWLELDKEMNDKISSQEWIVLCDKLNVPLKKSDLLNMYKAAVNLLEDKQSLLTPEGPDEGGDGLPLKAVAEMLGPLRKLSLEAMGFNDVDLDDHATRIWNEIFATDPLPPSRDGDGADSYVELAVEREGDEETISTVAFLSFIRSQQKEYRTALEDAANLCRLLNRQVMASDLDDADQSSSIALIDVPDAPKSSMSTARLSKSRFLSYLMSDANDILDPTKGEQGTIDMTRPLSHYWINTAHDTYLARLPNALSSGRSIKDAADHSHHEVVDEQMYWAALYRGVRCIELDVWDCVSWNEPVVARKQPTPQNFERNVVSFTEVLRIVRAFLQQKPDSYPIIIKLENHCSLPFQRKLSQQLVEVLGSLLHIPSDSNGVNKSPMTTSASLPSPASLRGHVVIIGKRPKSVRQGATVVNDDFDDENGVVVDDETLLNELLEDDDDEDDDTDAVVVGFNERGPVKKPASSPGATRRSPSFLLDIATNEANDAQREAKLAEKRWTELKTDATAAEMLAAQLTEEAGFTPSEVRAISAAQLNRDEVAPGGFEIELDVNNKNNVSVRGVDSHHQPEEGLEVQDFFGDAVEGAKSQYTEADAKALEANQNAARSLVRLNEAKLALEHAERDLEASYQREKDLAREAQRAATEARTNREHADTARRRVETVRELLRSCIDSASSAETVVVTAYTESKISEQRASEAEARASRAMSTAEKDRATADEESRKEELLEQEVEKLHVDYVESTKASRAARDRLEKATAMLDRVNEQIKLIEQSSQYQKEIREQRATSYLDEDDGSQNSKPRHGSKFLDKHAAKIEERKMCQDLIKEASAENANADQSRRHAQVLFEERAALWRTQAERAAVMRKQAERSSHIAEELAEHAEEEREAASLRHIAREKAQANVQQSDSYRASVEAQLAEAERAASEASSTAVENRNRAEQLAREAEKSKNHTEAILMVEHKKRDLEVAAYEYELALTQKTKAESDAAVAKRVLDTSSEVFSSAQRDAAAEIHRVNEDRAAKRRAVEAYNKALQARKAVDRAKEQCKGAKALLAQKNAALKQAQQFKQKADKITEIDTGLATMTLLHTCKHKHWGKSIALPSAYMHSMAQGVVQQMIDKDAEKQREFFAAFTSNHMVRTFPSWHVTEHTPYANYDPVSQWSLGCQLVAMNFNCVDERVLVNDGRFRANGSSGYILKPDFLIDDTKQRERQERWKFSILSASCLPKPEWSMGRKGLSGVGGSSMHYINPYVKISVFDETTSSGKVVHATRPVARNGFNPVWKEKNEVEVAIPSPSLAVILVTVWDKTDNGNDDFIAAAALPVSCLREGYRSVALFDSMHTRCGAYAFASLLFKAQKLST